MQYSIEHEIHSVEHSICLVAELSLLRLTLVKILQPLLVPNKPPALNCHPLRQVTSVT